MGAWVKVGWTVCVALLLVGCSGSSQVVVGDLSAQEVCRWTHSDLSYALDIIPEGASRPLLKAHHMIRYQEAFLDEKGAEKPQKASEVKARKRYNTLQAEIVLDEVRFEFRARLEGRGAMLEGVVDGASLGELFYWEAGGGRLLGGVFLLNMTERVEPISRGAEGLLVRLNPKTYPYYRSEHSAETSVGCGALSLRLPESRHTGQKLGEPVGKRSLKGDEPVPVSTRAGGPIHGTLSMDKIGIGARIVSIYEEAPGWARIHFVGDGPDIFGWVPEDRLEAAPVLASLFGVGGGGSGMMQRNPATLACSKAVPLGVLAEGQVFEVGHVAAGAPIVPKADVGEHRTVTLTDADWLRPHKGAELVIRASDLDACHPFGSR